MCLLCLIIMRCTYYVLSLRGVFCRKLRLLTQSSAVNLILLDFWLYLTLFVGFLWA